MSLTAWNCLAAVGLLLCLRSVFTLLRGIWRYFLRPGKDLHRLGSWAIVTGSTDGIGRAFAEALAKKGLNLMLVSRTESKLAAVANEIAYKYKIEAKYTVVDFAHADDATWGRMADSLKGLDVGLLINNVGLSYDHPEYFDELSDAEIRDIVEVNITSVNQMTRIVLPLMRERGRGAIVNLGSAAGSVVPSTPLVSVYAGTKGYVDIFTKSMQVELAQFGISVQNMAPLFVATKMSKIRKARIDAPSATQWANAAVKHIGYETTSSPWWFHALQWYFITIGPVSLLNGYTLNLHLGMRRRYYKKVGKKAKDT